MKNKKWKRKAKRIYGKCLEASCCTDCEFQNKYGNCGATRYIVFENIPLYLGIRELESLVKEDNTMRSIYE